MFGFSQPKKKDRPAIMCGSPLDPTQNQYTPVILGVPRGGTTMVAGVAQRCGLHIGSNLPANLEDPDFAHATIAQMKETIVDRNAERDVWGWKFPAAARYLPRLMPLLRNPRLIVVWRDLVATTGRKLAKADDWFTALHVAHRHQAKNLRLLQSPTCPILLVSYERAIRHPLEFAETISEFLALPMPDDREELVRFMEPGTYK